MKSRLFAALVVSALISWNANAESGFTLYECNKANLNSYALHTAATNVAGLGYVGSAINQAIAENGPKSSHFVCYSGFPLKKNIYQYYKFLMKFEVRATKNGPVTHVFHMLYQDASTQANHGLEDKPWVGLKKADVEQVLATGIGDVDFVKVAHQDGSDDMGYIRESALYKSNFGHSVGSALYSYDIPSAGKVSISSWLTAVGSGTFAGSEVPEGVLVRHNTDGSTEIADVTWMATRFLFPLEEKLYEELRTLREDQYQARLLELSRVR